MEEVVWITLALVVGGAGLVDEVGGEGLGVALGEAVGVDEHAVLPLPLDHVLSATISLVS